MADKKYKVCEGVALTAKGVMFKAGDEVPADVLTEDSIKALVAAKKIAEFKADDGKNSEDDKKADDGKNSEDDKKADDGKKSEDDKKADDGKKPGEKKADDNKSEEKK